MYTISAKKLPHGFEFFRDNQPVASPRDEWELELCLNFHGVFEGFCRDFICRLKETGNAAEEMPTVDFRQVPCPW